VVVDRGLANARSLRNGVHARGLNAALGKERKRGLEDLFVSFDTARSHHG